jgi:hypothetical protein
MQARAYPVLAGFQRVARLALVEDLLAFVGIAIGMGGAGAEHNGQAQGYRGGHKSPVHQFILLGWGVGTEF